MEISPTNKFNVRPWKAITIGELDFYLCPKCATNTIKYAQYKFYGGTKSISDYRDDTYKVLALKTGDVNYQQERETSIKVAVKRDPVERFISATRWYNYKYNMNLSVLDILKYEPDDPHFYTQTYFYGDHKKYDVIINMEQVSEIILKFTGVDLGTLHKGKQRAPELQINNIERELIKEYYRIDYENTYC